MTGNAGSAHALLDLGEAAPELGPVIIRQLRRAPDDLSAALYEAIVLDRAGGAARLSIALLACAQLERELAPDLERSVLARCLELLRRAPDPYDVNAARVVGAARQAAAAIVARNPDLDDVLIAKLADAERRASLTAVAAAAFQEQPAEAARRFVNYAKTLRLSTEQLIRFAEDCDSNRQPRVTRSTSKRRPWPAAQGHRRQPPLQLAEAQKVGQFLRPFRHRSSFGQAEGRYSQERYGSPAFSLDKGRGKTWK